MCTKSVNLATWFAETDRLILKLRNKAVTHFMVSRCPAKPLWSHGSSGATMQGKGREKPTLLIRQLSARALAPQGKPCLQDTCVTSQEEVGAPNFS